MAIELVKILITVVLAAKDPEPKLLDLCLASFAALSNAKKIQLIVVRSGVCDVTKWEILNSFGAMLVIDCLPEGVYAAYNKGILSAKGTYVLFFGVDDIALPDMDIAINYLDSYAGEIHLYASACYMQKKGILKPSSFRLSLIFQNWCHQGIFYLRDYLLNNPYETQYKIQADHKLNIDIVSNKMLNFQVSKNLIAYFSAGGASSLNPDYQFRSNFPEIVRIAYGVPYGILVKIKQILVDLIFGSPSTLFKSKSRD